MIINGNRITYKFGPENDMDIQFSGGFQLQAGVSYDQCGNPAKLTFQMICHAVRQVQAAAEKSWTLEKIETSEDWEYRPCKESKNSSKQTLKARMDQLYSRTFSNPSVACGRQLPHKRESPSPTFSSIYAQSKDANPAKRLHPVLVKSELTYAKYQIKDRGRLVVTLRESPSCDFLIDYYDPQDDGWIDLILEYAYQHCRRFGRRG